MRHKKLSVLLLTTVIIVALAGCNILPSLDEWIDGNVGEFGTGRETEQVENTERVSDRQTFTIPEMEETVLVDENDIKITATDLKLTNSTLEIDLLIENNSDKNLSFLSGTVGYNCNEINGYMMDDGYLNADVIAGKKANETIRFGLSQLLLFGIREIADIRIGFEIQDDNYDSVYTGARQTECLKSSI